MQIKILILFSIVSILPLFLTDTLTARDDSIQTESPEIIFQKGKALYNQKKYKEAFPFMEKAASMGHSDAQMHLGKMYYNGWGVAHDHKKAEEWHKKAAAQGNSESVEKLKKMKHH